MTELAIRLEELERTGTIEGFAPCDMGELFRTEIPRLNLSKRKTYTVRLLRCDSPSNDRAVRWNLYHALEAIVPTLDREAVLSYVQRTVDQYLSQDEFWVSQFMGRTVIAAVKVLPQNDRDNISLTLSTKSQGYAKTIGVYTGRYDSIDRLERVRSTYDRIQSLRSREHNARTTSRDVTSELIDARSDLKDAIKADKRNSELEDSLRERIAALELRSEKANKRLREVSTPEYRRRTETQLDTLQESLRGIDVSGSLRDLDDWKSSIAKYTKAIELLSELKPNDRRVS